MSTDVLRRASALMRENAEAATPGPWWAGGAWFDHIHEADGRITHSPRPTVGHGSTGADMIAATMRADGADAAHIAAADPPFMLAVADLLDQASRSKIHGFDPDDCPDCRSLVAVARRYLSEEAS